MRLASLVLLCAAALAALLTSCPERGTHGLTGDDLVMYERTKLLFAAINTYHSDTAEWPDSLEAVAGHLPPGETWPANPYNNQPIADTGSQDFDAATSVGMVYYQKFYREDQLVNCHLHVFGRRGTIHIFGSTAFGPKK